MCGIWIQHDARTIRQNVQQLTRAVGGSANVIIYSCFGGDNATVVNAGLEVKLWQERTGRTFVTLASANSYEFYASGKVEQEDRVCRPSE